MKGLPDEVRVQALTNLGNSFDIVGRNADGVEAYREALALDPNFGMALGNKGVALLGIAPLMQQHAAAGVVEARDDLDAALEDRERILQIGGLGALEHFEKRRASITMTGSGHDLAAASWTDPYWRWCAQHNLLLHVSPRCIDPEADAYDPLFFRSVTTGLDDADQRRVNDLFDAFNANQAHLPRQLGDVAVDVVGDRYADPLLGRRVGHPVAAEEHLLVCQRQTSDLPADHKALEEELGPAAPSVVL